MALRQLDFNVEALGAIAAKACGASECNEIGVIGEGRSDFVPEAIVLNPFQAHSTVYFASVSTLAMTSLPVSRFVMLDRGVSLHVVRWRRWTLFGLVLVHQLRKC